MIKIAVSNGPYCEKDYTTHLYYNADISTIHIDITLQSTLM
jgi:hypothetical protein